MKLEQQDLEIKVTRIADRWHARVFSGDMVLDEMACKEKRDIGYICRELLAFQGRLGWNTPRVEAARRSPKRNTPPAGKIWHRPELDREKSNQIPNRLDQPQPHPNPIDLG